jgi:hypothetical protein
MSDLEAFDDSLQANPEPDQAAESADLASLLSRLQALEEGASRFSGMKNLNANTKFRN